MYNALRGVDDFGIALKGIEMEQRSSEYIDQASKQDHNEYMLLQQQMAEYMDQFKNLPITDQDMAKVKAVESAERTKLANAIRENGGDVRKFLVSGGFNQLKAYGSNVRNSQAMRTAIRNGMNITLANKMLIEDQKVAHRVRVPINGKMEEVPYDVALDMYDKGQIEELPFRGGFDAWNEAETIKFFRSMASDIGPMRQVHPNELKVFLDTQKKFPSWYVNEIVANYEKNVFNPNALTDRKNPFNWGENSDMLDRQLKREAMYAQGQEQKMRYGYIDNIMKGRDVNGILRDPNTMIKSPLRVAANDGTDITSMFGQNAFVTKDFATLASAEDAAVLAGNAIFPKLVFIEKDGQLRPLATTNELTYIEGLPSDLSETLVMNGKELLNSGEFERNQSGTLAGNIHKYGTEIMGIEGGLDMHPSMKGIKLVRATFATKKNQTMFGPDPSEGMDVWVMIGNANVGHVMQSGGTDIANHGPLGNPMQPLNQMTGTFLPQP